jgi:hypothetical protein
LIAPTGRYTKISTLRPHSALNGECAFFNQKRRKIAQKTGASLKKLQIYEI